MLCWPFFGVGLAFFFEYLDNTVKTPEDVEQLLRLPSFGMIRIFPLRGVEGSITDNPLRINPPGRAGHLQPTPVDPFGGLSEYPDLPSSLVFRAASEEDCCDEPQTRSKERRPL